MMAMDYRLEVQGEDEEEYGQEEKIDEELLYSRVFFMGLVAGVIHEKMSDQSPAKLNKEAQKFVKQVPTLMENAADYAKVNSLLEQITDELGGAKPLNASANWSMSQLDASTMSEKRSSGKE